VSRTYGDDIFVSYARLDAVTYAASLCNELVNRQFACKFDQWGSEPGQELPDSLRRAVRRSAMFVLVASPGALLSNNVGKEISEFLKTGRTIIPDTLQ